ncbi:MAG: hypothetical protein IH571_02005 [Acholeplasmataceae bacterium]|nr:hypothetical protein [Acholeplasmataceae bacterium]
MDRKILESIQKTAFQYFQDFTNLDEFSLGFGLTADHNMKTEVASIAATGFMLSSYIIGIEYGYIEREKARSIVEKTLHTLAYHVDHKFGFFAHFLDIKTGQRHKLCEYSTIDTALALNGVIAVDAYFNDLEISKLSGVIFNRIEWDRLVHVKRKKKMLYMSYNPDKGGDYTEGHPGFIFQWDMLAEQLMMYVMIAGGTNINDAIELYKGFDRIEGKYDKYQYYYSPGNALFVYQFPLAWLDLEHSVDTDGISWFENAKKATLAHRALSISLHDQFKTFSNDFWGFSAADTPRGYRVFGGLPNAKNIVHTDGSVSPFSAIGSLPMTPIESMSAIEAMLQIPNLYDEKYGFKDSFNFEGEHPWISQKHIAINKGLEMLMANAVLTKDVMKVYMSHPIIQKGMGVLKWEKNILKTDNKKVR